MAGHEVADCGAENIEVEPVGDVDGERHVVGAAGLVDLLDEPEPPLEVGEDRWGVWAAAGHGGPPSGLCGEAGGKRGRGRCFEQVADPDVDAEEGAEPGDDTQ